MTVLTIAWRELRAIFTTSIGWLVLCGYLVVMGGFWTLLLSGYVLASSNLVYDPYAANYLSTSRDLMVPFFGNAVVIWVMVAPALSMRVFSEEFKQRTMELLFTSPVSTAEIVLGKFLGVLGFICVLQAGTVYLPLTLFTWGSPDVGVIAGGALGLTLLAASLVSMGLLFSALTTNQIVALLMTFASSLMLLVADWASQSPDDWFSQLSFMPHLTDLFQGAVRLSDLTYFACFIAFFLFATHQRMESFRWR